jgi:hypothetical protein
MSAISGPTSPNRPSSPVEPELSPFEIKKRELEARIASINAEIERVKEEECAGNPDSRARWGAFSSPRGRELLFERMIPIQKLEKHQLREKNKEWVFCVENLPEYYKRAEIFAQNDGELFKKIKEAMDNPKFQKSPLKFLLTWKEQLRKASIDHEAMSLSCTERIRYKSVSAKDPVYDFLRENFAWWEKGVQSMPDFIESRLP